MKKEKVVSLTKYLDRLNDKLTSPVTKKHTHHPDSFKQFLKREIDMVKAKLEVARLEGVDKK